MSEVLDTLDNLRRVSERDLCVDGPCEIEGQAYVQGSKNIANKLVPTAVALPGKYEIYNFPQILDPLELLSLVELLGGKVSVHDNTVSIDTTTLQNKPLPYELTKSTSAAFSFAGALLGRFGSVQIGKPGGDKIGPRPIDLHLTALQSLGAEVSEYETSIQAQLAETPRNKDFKLRIPSTGAAVNFALAVVGAGGSATLENSPVDGDMQAMYKLLRAAGVTIDIKGTTTRLDATDSKAPKSTIVFTCPADRNDAFTWLCYGALSRAGLLIERFPMDDLEGAMKVLRSLGVQLTITDENSVFVTAPQQYTDSTNGRTIVAGLSKDFHSDWAPLIEVVLATLPGNYRVIDTLFSNRVRQAELLHKMGADVRISGGSPPKGVAVHFSPDAETRYIVDVCGPAKLKALTAPVGYDVRACAAMVMAASQAEGTSQLSEAQALYRGYEYILGRLSSIGVNITNVNK